MNLTSSEYEHLKAELKAEILQEIAIKKRTEHIWSKAKKSLKERAQKSFPGSNTNGYKISEALAVIGRIAFDRNTVSSLTTEDVENINRMLEEMLAIVLKYKREVGLLTFNKNEPLSEADTS